MEFNLFSFTPVSTLRLVIITNVQQKVIIYKGKITYNIGALLFTKTQCLNVEFAYTKYLQSQSCRKRWISPNYSFKLLLVFLKLIARNIMINAYILFQRIYLKLNIWHIEYYNIMNIIIWIPNYLRGVYIFFERYLSYSVWYIYF